MPTPTPSEFEDEVRRVARALWPSSQAQGAAIVDGREVDGLYQSEEVIHHVEATMDRTVAKARHDGPKLRDHLKRNRSGRGKFAKAWFVTYHDPTGDQRKVLHNEFDRNIEVISFEDFRGKLINAREYLHLRDLSDWGSPTDPRTLSRVNLPAYVPLQLSVLMDKPITTMQKATPSNRAGAAVGLDALIEALRAGSRIALLGDYGAGKSMTIREIHRKMAGGYLRKEQATFPVTLNLRHHYGQNSPEEALRRHAEQIGFEPSSQLVRAWRAGYVHVLLDGFDELAAPGWSGTLERLRENRRAATRLIKEFASTTPGHAGVVVAGRRYYFDSLEELGRALFERQAHVITSLSDFTPSQARAFIQTFREWDYAIPAWLPARPLLLGYLAAEGLLETVEDSGAVTIPPAAGWHWLLERICEREAFIKSGMDGTAVRLILERLASVARTTPQGIGSLSAYDIANAFAAVRGRGPSDEDLTLLQRLPGLGGEESREEGTRSFIDADLASAAQAGDVARYIVNPFTDERNSRFQPSAWTSSMEPLGAEVAAEQLEDLTDGVIRTAFSRAAGSGFDVLAADILQVALIKEAELSSPGVRPSTISGVVIPTWTSTKSTGTYRASPLMNAYSRNCHSPVIRRRKGCPDLPLAVSRAL